MNPAFDLMNQSVVIYGLGLMGGSLAMVLKDSCKELLAVDHNPAVVKMAVEEQLVDQADTDPLKILPMADLIILATPVQVIIDQIKQLPDWKPEGAVVIDLGSTKTEICAALSALPPQFSAVGGHPMCGKTAFSLENADPDLFCNCMFPLVKLSNSSEKSIHLAEAIVKRTGAAPLWIDPHTHDAWVSVTSHFPYLMANLLASITPLNVSPLISSGWQSTARLAGSSTQMMEDILKTNRSYVLGVLDQFTERLLTVKVLLEAEDFDGLKAMMEIGHDQYQLITQKGFPAL